jgi:hypothetical protein
MLPDPPRSATYFDRETEWISSVLIGILLTGYALFSKGFAYLGFHSIFVGEIVLSACLLLFITRPSFSLFSTSRIVWLIGAFWVLCLMQTIPYLGKYGLDSLRDGVIYGYSLFALLVGTLMVRQDRTRALLPAYEVTSMVVVILSPFVILMLRPHLADMTRIPLIFQKAGDLSVHLVGAAAFRLVGLQGASSIRSAGLRRLLNFTFWLSWLICAVWAVSVSRGALVTILVGMLIVFAMGFGRRTILLSGAAVIAVGVILGAFQVSIRQGGIREISTEQIFANTLSIVADVGPGTSQRVNVRNLQSNVQWRLRWWRKIVDYTIYGDGFWTGRGFGVNLATIDDFQVDARQSLRSPHSIHMTILARAGVPGLVLWWAILFSMAGALIGQALRMRRSGRSGWCALNVWVLTYWVASVVNGSFDVYLEGPQGGIWFWCLMGLAIAIVEIEKRAQIGGMIAPAPGTAFASA